MKIFFDGQQLYVSNLETVLQSRDFFKPGLGVVIREITIYEEDPFICEWESRSEEEDVQRSDKCCKGGEEGEEGGGGGVV